MGALAASPWLVSWSVWGIAAMATAGVILRPFALPEFIWAITGAVLLIALHLLPAADALAGVVKGSDVYLFLIGMMLLAELAGRRGCSTGSRQKRPERRGARRPGFSRWFLPSARS